MQHLARCLGLILVLIGGSTVAVAQKSGGVLKMLHGDSPASMSILEESTIVSEGPMMAVFNNLVLFDQHIAQNSLDTIRPELATDWAWNDDRTVLTLHLREGVRWHDGLPFTAADVKCTWDLLQGKGTEKLRINPRKSWWENLDAVTANGDYEVSFHLKRPQPSFIELLASGWSPIYPCHVPPREMRQHPIGTGPFKFVEFKPNERIVLTKNPDYWRPRRPYLDGIEYTIIRNTSTGILALGAHQLDRTGVGFYAPALLKDIQQAGPQLECQTVAWNASRTAILNETKPPFDNPDLRRAVALTLDRKAFIDIIGDGEGEVGATMQPAPEGVWGMPAEMLKTLPGYGSDIAANRAEARKLMEKAGYGPDKRLSLAVAARNVGAYRDPAVILIDQLKEIYIDGTLDIVDTTQWYPKVMRKDYQIGFTVTESGLDDPDQNFYENYSCKSERNYTGFCSPEVDGLIDKQSAEPDGDKRRQIVWEIERRLAEDAGRPIIFHPKAIHCMYPDVKGFTVMVNSNYNGWRMEDIWLDR
jgi:peptide/nickel transport system substrate-binding protein